MFAARRVVIDNLDALPHGSDGFRRRIAGIVVVVILFVRVAHVDVDIHATLGADDGDAHERVDIDDAVSKRTKRAKRNLGNAHRDGS